uniref:Uncharacterized protein LOC105114439 n=1 Tax=Rhizophora mucronata TaxID=61149 RepID=A0A2P2KV28_RHIMU
MSSEEILFPLRSLQLKSTLSSLSELLSPILFFITFKEESGIFSSPCITNFCKAAWILAQSEQQNHSPFGNSFRSCIL